MRSHLLRRGKDKVTNGRKSREPEEKEEKRGTAKEKPERVSLQMR